MRGILNEWGLSAAIRARSGTPLTVTSGRDNNLDGNSNDRADLTGDPKLSANRARADVTTAWFNTATFAQNAAGQPGTSGRNILDKLGLKIVDLALMRNFRFKEHVGMQFRAETTNSLNLVNLNGPNTTLTSLAFGTIRDAQPMREIQLGF